MRLLAIVALLAVCTGCGSRSTAVAPGDPLDPAPGPDPVGPRPGDGPPGDDLPGDGIPGDDPLPDPVPIPPRPPPGAAGEWPPIEDALREYELVIAPRDLAALDADVEDRDLLVPARFVFDGRSWDVQVRYRGRSARFLPKKSWQVRFPDEDRLHERKSRLELIAEYRDGGMLTERVFYDLAAAAGVRAPVARYVNLTVNGRYYGVMTEVEAVNKAFLAPHGFDRDSDVYRCGMHDCEMREPALGLPDGTHRQAESYQERWEKRTNERQPWDELWAFLRKVERTPPHLFAEFAEREVDLEGFLSWLAVDEAISNDFEGDSRSFLVRDWATRKWSYVPWDLNNSRAIYNRNNGLRQSVKSTRAPLAWTLYDPNTYDLARERAVMQMKPGWSTLGTRVIDDPSLRPRFVAALRALLDRRFNLEQLGPRIDQLHALLAPHLARDRFVDQEYAARSADFLKRFVDARHRWLRERLAEYEAHGSGPLRVGAVGRDAAGQVTVEICNAGAEPLPLRGLHLTGNPRVPGQSELPPLTVPPGGAVRLGPGGDAPLRAAVDPEKPQVALFGADARTAVDVLFLGPLAPGEAYGRSACGEQLGPL